MIVERPDPSQLDLQATVQNVDGSPKLALASALVRVYHLDGSAEIVDLLPTTLVQVGETNVWQYIWAPGTLARGQYFAEYSLVDGNGVASVNTEPIVIEDFAQQTDLDLLVQLESGKWEIVNNQMIFYDTGDVEIMRFNLYDIDGVLTNGINMYKRVPV